MCISSVERTELITSAIYGCFGQTTYAGSVWSQLVYRLLRGDYIIYCYHLHYILLLNYKYIVYTFRPPLVFVILLLLCSIDRSVRYGHCLIQVKDDVLAVVGGCSVSVQSEVVGSTIGPTETKNLIDLSNTLQVGWQAIIVIVVVVIRSGSSSGRSRSSSSSRSGTLLV